MGSLFDLSADYAQIEFMTHFLHFQERAASAKVIKRVIATHSNEIIGSRPHSVWHTFSSFTRWSGQGDTRSAGPFSYPLHLVGFKLLPKHSSFWKQTIPKIVQFHQHQVNRGSLKLENHSFSCENPSCCGLYRWRYCWCRLISHLLILETILKVWLEYLAAVWSWYCNCSLQKCAQILWTLTHSVLAKLTWCLPLLTGVCSGWEAETAKPAPGPVSPGGNSVGPRRFTWQVSSEQGHQLHSSWSQSQHLATDNRLGAHCALHNPYQGCSRWSSYSARQPGDSKLARATIYNVHCTYRKRRNSLEWGQQQHGCTIQGSMASGLNSLWVGSSYLSFDRKVHMSIFWHHTSWIHRM